MTKEWSVYLSGEIHTDWRDEIQSGVGAHGLPIRFTGPVLDHETSDMIGVRILGDETDTFWRDRKGSGINGIRTATHIRQADLVVVRFGPKYRQWNAAFDAGYATALEKPLITLHDEDLDHALKEVNSWARATARTPQQVVDILKYIVS
jgi:YtoQ family protein